MKKILITGGKGQLGMSLNSIKKSYPRYQMVFTDIEELDISDKEGIGKTLDEDEYYAIINCAAYTAVDKAEEEVELSTKLNALAPKYLGEEASKRGIRLIHISTDYVFDGSKNTPYSPKDEAEPNSIYGKTKLEGEKNIMSIEGLSYLIIRTSWLYSQYGHNFVKTMARLGSERDEITVVYDQVGSPTYAKDLAIGIMEALEIMDADTRELFHFSNEGVCSWYDFAYKIMELKDLKAKVSPILSKGYPTPAPRPHYSVLDKSEFRAYTQRDIPHWEESLKICIKNI